MTLRDLLPDSIFGTIATVKDDESLNKAYGFIQHNHAFIDHFPRIAVALNSADTCTPELMAQYKKLWMDAFPWATCWSLDRNRGHMFGTIDLDESLVIYARKHFIKHPYLFKSTEDVLLDDKMLDKKIQHADFYYLPGFSYETIVQCGGLIYLKERLKNLELPAVPQTNFFILNLKKVDSLYGNNVNEKKNIYKKLLRFQPHLKPWEVDFEDGMKFDMETLLHTTTKSLSKFSLLNDESIGKLCNFVHSNGIGDPSHKNIFFEEIGLCHFHNYREPVYSL